MNLVTQRSLNRVNAAGQWAKAKVAGVIALATAGAASAQTATDYGAGAAISAAQTTMLGIIGAFITMGIAIWAASYVLRRFFPKGR